MYLELIDEDVEARTTMMGLDAARIRAVVRKELRDYRRKRSIVVTMAILPCIFLIQPVLTIFLTPASTASSTLDKTVSFSLLFLLLDPGHHALHPRRVLGCRRA